MGLDVNVVGVTVHSHREAEAAAAPLINPHAGATNDLFIWKLQSPGRAGHD